MHCSKQNNSSLKLDIMKRFMTNRMSSFIPFLFITYLFFQESDGCLKHQSAIIPCDVHTYYYGNCTYDRFGIREQMRLPEGNE